MKFSPSFENSEHIVTWEVILGELVKSMKNEQSFVAICMSHSHEKRN